MKTTVIDRETMNEAIEEVLLDYPAAKTVAEYETSKDFVGASLLRIAEARYSVVVVDQGVDLNEDDDDLGLGRVIDWACGVIGHLSDEVCVPFSASIGVDGDWFDWFELEACSKHVGDDVHA